MLACIICNCIYIVFAIVLCLVLPRVVQMVAGVVVISSVFVCSLRTVIDTTSHGTGQTRRGPLCVSRESRRRVVRGYEGQSGRIVCVLAVDSLLALSECVSCYNGPLTV